MKTQVNEIEILEAMAKTTKDVNLQIILYTVLGAHYSEDKRSLAEMCSKFSKEKRSEISNILIRS